MSDKEVHVERDGPVGILRIDRPPANTIELNFAREFRKAFDELVATDVGAIVIAGTGSFFSGGLDLNIIPHYSPEEQQTFLTETNRMLGKAYGVPIPVVGAINGHAIAGGFVLAITCDYRVGPNGPYNFGLTEARLGVPFPAAPMAVLRTELALADLRVIMLRAKHFGSEEALARGVFDELQEAGDVLPRAIEIARDMASMPREGYGRIKAQVREQALAYIKDTEDPMLKGWLSDEVLSASKAVLRGEAGAQSDS
jgi:enoyl-CoA hydratase